MQLNAVHLKASRRTLGLGLLPLVCMLSLAACGAQNAPAAAPVAQATSAPVVTTAAAQPTAVVVQQGAASVQPTTVQTGAAAAQPTTAQPAATAAATAGAKVKLNTATAADFLKLPNVGNNMVREFNEYRPWTSILQFRREIGKYVDAATITGFEQYVYVPVSANSADADTLMQLPGVDKTISAQLIASRPYASNDTFLANLTKLVGADNATLAKTYLAAQ